MRKKQTTLSSIIYQACKDSEVFTSQSVISLLRASRRNDEVNYMRCIGLMKRYERVQKYCVARTNRGQP